ncbi:MAG: 50S ribosomal protein L25 [Candidatus Pacebacteria bacterium]|nr:50S ribosomal protein L25 [Candidatus Paceibacterota bacterium]
MIKLEVNKREKKKSKNELLGVVYGSNLKENILIQIDNKSFKEVYEKTGKSNIFTLIIDGKDYNVLIKDIQISPLKDNIIHVDFYAVTRNQEIEVEIPFEFINESEAVKLGGILNIAMNKIAVKTLPDKIPPSIKIDLSILKEEGDSIKLKDISLAKNVKFLSDNLNDTIVSILVAKEEVEEKEEKIIEENIENKDKIKK